VYSQGTSRQREKPSRSCMRIERSFSGVDDRDDAVEAEAAEEDSRQAAPASVA
jgi:hypothetical protein